MTDVDGASGVLSLLDGATAAEAVDGAPLTPKQMARRRRVIEAALLLGSEGGYDAVHMRDVATTAGVALGTIYRYFNSKDHLLAAAVAEWTNQLHDRLQRVPPRGDTEVDRLVEALRRGTRTAERHPTLTSAMVRALGSSDAGVARTSVEMGRPIRAIAHEILLDVPPDVLEALVKILEHVWYSALTQWANGRIELAAVGDELERAARLMLTGHPGPSRVR
jgi:AcrR family transcriptional regulator